MAKILITGAAGYIGSILTEHLITEGHEVLAVDNLMYDQVPFGNLFASRRLRFIRGDATSREFVWKILAKEIPDFVIPLAAIVGYNACDLQPALAKATNTAAISDILEYRQDGTKIIFPTTNSGYGNTNGSLLCTEDTPLNPISTYGQTKMTAEKEVLAASETLTFRLATLFGVSPRMRTDLLVNDFVLKAVRDRALVLYEKEYKRNVLHVRDCARAFSHAIQHFDEMKGRAYNVGNSKYNISKWELAEMIKEQLPNTRIFHVDDQKDPDQRNYIVSNERIEKTGFCCKHSLPDGIAELIRGYAAMNDRRFRNI